MKKHYVLIDYENVQPEALGILDDEAFHVIVFVGANQSKVSFEVASALQRMGNRADYIRITGNGSNALDFHIAFHLGQIAAQDPDACFHIISKDKGFDPLVQHLNDRKIRASRTVDVTGIRNPAATDPKGSEDRMDMIVADLRRRGAAKPRTVKTLGGTIHSIFRKQLSEQELSELLSLLEKRGFIAIDGTKVSYSLSG